MSYRISYTSEGTRKQRIHHIRIPAIILIAIPVMLLVAYVFYAGQRTQIMQMLFPWTEPFTQAAIIRLRESVQQGIPVADAVSVFIYEVIANGYVY